MFQTSAGRYFIAVAAFLAVLVSPVLYGDDLYFESRDISELTVDSIRDIAEDSLGYIWVATPGGIVRYDGHEYVLWDREKFAQAASEDSVRLVSEDIVSLEYAKSTDTLWIGSDAGLMGYNLSSKTLESVQFSHLGNRVSDQQITDIEISPDGRLFSLTHDGVYARDSDGKMFEVPVVDESGRSTGIPLSELGSDCTDKLWAVAIDGLKVWNPVKNRFDHELDVPNLRKIECIGKSLWLSTSDSVIYRYTPESRYLEPYYVPGPVVDFAQGSKGRIWMASSSTGLDLLSAETGAVEHIPVDNEHPYKLSTEKVSSLHSSGNLMWVGTIDSGLYSIDPRKENNLSYIRRSGNNSLPNGPINSVIEDSLGYLWIGSNIGGLARIDPVTGEIRQYLSDPDDYFSIGNDHITSVLEDSTGKIWVGTDEGPALYISEIEGFEPPDLMMGGWPDLRGTSVLAMAEGGDGSIWMSLRDGRLFKLDPLDRDFRMFPSSSAAVPKILHADRFGSLWAGSLTNLQLFRNDGQPVRIWDLTAEAAPPQLSGGIAAIFSDSKDRNWFGGPLGLTIYVPETESFLPILFPDGRNVVASGIAEDLGGNIWVADDRELHVFDTDLKFVSTIGENVGFTPSVSISELIQGEDGEILVGAKGEIWTFENLPNQIFEILPPVHISAIYIAGNRLINSTEAMSQENLEIAPDQNSLTIEFGSVSFESHENLSYRYRMDGVDSDWLLTHETRTIRYPNLPYGERAFHIQSFDTLSGIEGPEVELDIKVFRPLWQKWWMILLYVAVVAALVAMFIRLREGELLREQIQALEVARSEALKANQKLEILTMNDTLSGLLNRRGFDRSIDHALSTASRNDLMISLFMMDVDYFKRYNDNYGHVRGDEVLRAVGRALKSVFGRSTDIIARYGGEEFSVVFIGVNPNAMVILANEFLTAIDNLDIVHDYSDASDRLTLSVGSATIMATTELTAESLVEMSDKALYHAKQSGRKRVCYTGIIPELPELMDNGTAPIILDVETVE